VMVLTQQVVPQEHESEGTAFHSWPAAAPHPLSPLCPAAPSILDGSSAPTSHRPG
jgi:hypothetical protein